MTEKITLCGDNCAVCPRYNANTDEKLSQVAELWHRIGWRETILSAAEMRCTGCSSHKKCTYNLVDCTISHEVKRCNSRPEFPCETINAMLERSRFYQRKCKEVCSPDEYVALECAFFHKEENLKKV